MPESEVRRICADEPSVSGRSIVTVTTAWASSERSIESTVPTGWPATQDLVARHELPAGLEHELVLAPAVVAEEHHDDERDRSDERAQREQAGERVPALRQRSARRFRVHRVVLTSPPSEPFRPAARCPSWALVVQPNSSGVIVSLLRRQPSVFSADRRILNAPVTRLHNLHSRATSRGSRPVSAV